MAATKTKRITINQLMDDNVELMLIQAAQQKQMEELIEQYEMLFELYLEAVKLEEI